jgi:hypothetical protein
LFETPNTSGVAFVKQVRVLAKFNLTNKVIMYVKDEGVNLNSFTNTLIFIVSCDLYSYFNHLLAFALVMLCQRHANMPQMKLMWVRV